MSFRSSKNGDNILPFPGSRTSVAPGPAALLPVLIVLHQETSTPGRVGNALRALGSPSRYQASAVRRSAAGDAGSARRRGHLRRPDERQRSRRLCPPRDRLDRNSLARATGRFWAFAWAPRCWRSNWAHRSRRIMKAGWRSATIRSVRPPPDTRSARTGPSASITGTARVFNCLGGAELLAEGDDFPVQAYPVRPRVRLPVSSRCDLRDDASLDHARLRAHGFAGRASAPPSFRRPRRA